MSTKPDVTDDERARRTRRIAWGLAALALSIYAGFILWGVYKSML